MLPWRRSRMVLVEEERRRKGKSWLPSRSLLASVGHACPSFASDCPLQRLAGVFRSRRRKVQLSGENPSHSVRYLGNAVTMRAKGEGCTDEVVSKIWARSEQGAAGARMELTVSQHGIRLCPAEPGSGHSGHLYLLRRITHCGADGRRPKVLAWVYRHQLKNKVELLRCHAVRLDKASKARAIALLLLHNSAAAFNDFKRLKRLEDARHRRQQCLGASGVPLAPLRRLLNAQCPYQAAAERGRGAARLSVIAEEEDGEPDIGGISRRIGRCSINDRRPSLSTRTQVAPRGSE
ncbi:protein FAM43B [Narcine bancroftii]|uniref:protein FAM43B n=1 Tax=Narcine bancroftii TaxID=1343680 RepID=UPI0038313D40